MKHNLQFYDSLRPKGPQEEVAALRQEIKELQGQLLSGMANLPNLVAAAVQNAAMQGVNLQARDIQLAALAPDVAKGVDPAAAEAMANSQLELATRLARLAKESGEDDIDDAAIASILGPDSETQNIALQGFVSPSKVFLERNTAVEVPAVVRKDLSTTFGTGITTNLPPSTAPPASVTTADSTALDSQFQQLQPAASSQNIQTAAVPGGRLITLTEAQLRDVMLRGHPAPAAPILPYAAPAVFGGVNFNQGMPSAAGNSPFWLPGTGAAAPSMMQQPQMLPEWQSQNPHTMHSMMAQSALYGGVQPGPVAGQQPLNPAFMFGGALPAPPPSFNLQRTQAQVPAGPILAPSASFDVEAQVRNLINAKFEEQQQQAARVNASAVDVRVLPPFGKCLTLMEVSS